MQMYCYITDKAVFTDANNNATVTGLIVGQTGVKFNDGTIQTTAFDGSTGGYDFTVSDGSNRVISSGNTVVWTGAEATVSYDAGTNKFSVSGTDQDLSSYARHMLMMLLVTYSRKSALMIQIYLICLA